MALGTAAALMVAGGGFSAATSVMAGNAQAKGIKQQGEFNAQIYDQQAEMIKSQKELSNNQFIRQSAFARGKIASQTAGKGLLLSGSPLAIMIDNESQMQFDKAIGDYNLDIESNYARSGANYSRQSAYSQARLAKFSGYSNAFSTMLNTGTNVAMLNMKPNIGKI